MQEFDFRDAKQLEILALGDLLEAYGGQQLALRTLKAKGDVHKFMTAITERVKSQPVHNAADRALGFSSLDDGAGYSIARAIRAAHEGKWNSAGLERDVSNLATTKTGAIPNGFFVPLGLMARDFNAGTASESGNLIGAALGADRAVDPIRKNSVLASMGATILTGLKENYEIPRFASSSSAAWGSEIASAAAVLETTSKVTLTPKRAAVQMVLSKQALRQATPTLDATISRHLMGALMELLERDAINGDGTSNSPVGIRSTASIGSVVGGTDGATITFSHLCDLEKAAETANCGITASSGYVVNAATKRWLRSLAIGTNLPYAWAGGDKPLLGHRAGVTNVMPSNLTKGASGAVCSSLVYSADWSQLVIGLYGGGVDVIVDHITMAPTGQVKITASILVGVGVTKAECFSKMDDAKTA